MKYWGIGFQYEIESKYRGETYAAEYAYNIDIIVVCKDIDVGYV